LTKFPSLCRGKVLILYTIHFLKSKTPPKASPTDLQSVPFGRSGTSPNQNHYFWIEQIPPGKEKDWKINELHKWNKDQHEFELIIFNKIQFFCQEIFLKKRSFSIS